jgi:phosphatidylserine/phosphatidylglycerophosphate/cardiolipin synthase-like enzyme
MIEFPVFPINETIQLDDRDYFPFLLGTVRTAKTRFWGSVFIVDTLSDLELKVRQLLKELAYACWRYVDVRLLIGDSDIEAISIGNGTSRYYCESLAIPIRAYVAGQGKQSLHSKYAVIDDSLVVIGSHNWSAEAFSANREGSVAVRSEPLVRILAREFEALWQAAEV